MGLAAYKVCKQYTALLGVVPLGAGVLRLGNPRRRRITDESQSGATKARDSQLRLKQRACPRLLAIVALTVATGADNLTIYVPLFGDAPQCVALYCGVFALLIPVWCATGYVLINNHIIGGHARRAGHLATPVVAIILGLWILSSTRSLL